MNISKQLGWMIGLGLLSFTLVGVGTASTPHDAQAAADAAPLCRPAPAPAIQSLASNAPMATTVVARAVGTGGAAGSGPPLEGVKGVRAFPLATATPKAPTTELVFFPLWARQ